MKLLLSRYAASNRGKKSIKRDLRDVELTSFTAYDTLELDALLTYGQMQLKLATCPILLPDNIRASRRKIEIAHKQEELRAYRQQKQARQEA